MIRLRYVDTSTEKVQEFHKYLVIDGTRRSTTASKRKSNLIRSHKYLTPLEKKLLYKLKAEFLPRYHPKSSLNIIRGKMQTALTFAPNLVPLAPSKNISQVASFPPKVTASFASLRCSPIKAATENYETSTVDYNSQISVFPAEACETVGGEACLADIYPEVRLQPQPGNDTPRIASENVEREYLEYNEAKTVFRGEACDDLGGIFCEREYQKGVY